tara:strand:- start:1721 stop:1855 length:135 start_codon:yes stop_codon:yes gene_type:complete
MQIKEWEQLLRAEVEPKKAPQLRGNVEPNRRPITLSRAVFDASF